MPAPRPPSLDHPFQASAGSIQDFLIPVQPEKFRYQKCLLNNERLPGKATLDSAISQQQGQPVPNSERSWEIGWVSKAD